MNHSCYFLTWNPSTKKNRVPRKGDDLLERLIIFCGRFFFWDGNVGAKLLDPKSSCSVGWNGWNEPKLVTFASSKAWWFSKLWTSRKQVLERMWRGREIGLMIQWCSKLHGNFTCHGYFKVSMSACSWIDYNKWPDCVWPQPRRQLQRSLE